MICRSGPDERAEVAVPDNSFVLFPLRQIIGALSDSSFIS
jgi:hypothetical protein